MFTHPRRWFAFRLRTLLIVMAVLATVCGWLYHERRVIQERTKKREALYRAIFVGTKRNYVIVPTGAGTSADQYTPWLWRMFGDSFVLEIGLLKDTPSDIVERIRVAFPEAKIVMFTDEFDTKR
jgi:hypothetical protein